MSSSPNLFWHRRDPRIRDNAGLAAAARDNTVVPVFVYETDLLGTIGSRQRALYFRHLRKLTEQYREYGSDLVVRAGEPSEVLVDLAEEYGADTVYYNDHYRAARRNRERRVETALSQAGIDRESRTDLVLVDPGRLESSYPNHSQFHNDWEQVPKRPPYQAPSPESLAEVSNGTTVPEPDADIDLPEGGYEAARDRLDTFIDTGITSYNDTRDDLAKAVDQPTSAVSRLSPYISTGAIGIREIWAAAGDVYDRVTGGERRNVRKYRYELSWREQNYHLLYNNPDLAVSNYKSFPNEIAWRNEDEEAEAWKNGETGYPLVDAGMRQLNQEGYIHNRPRQVVASFLTKHLLVDWRVGAQYFTKQLLDHDYASNYGNWQWTASTGTDSVDVRIFDPVSQASKYDDGAAFIREYVPELRDVPTRKIIDWPTLSAGERNRLAPEYPDPIVDRNQGYERAQRVFEEALGKR
jgi:deoxyribodipyrimidine photo-lyase